MMLDWYFTSKRFRTTVQSFIVGVKSFSYQGHALWFYMYYLSCISLAWISILMHFTAKYYVHLACDEVCDYIIQYRKIVGWPVSRDNSLKSAKYPPAQVWVSQWGRWCAGGTREVPVCTTWTVMDRERPTTCSVSDQGLHTRTVSWTLVSDCGNLYFFKWLIAFRADLKLSCCHDKMR